MIGIFISLWNRLIGAGGAPAETPILDTYGGAAAAYSTRLLSSSYGGSAVRVRRSFDNAEQDIGFSGGAIDETALMNFVGYQNLFLVSEAFTSASWGKSNVTITANAGTDPLGGNTASRLLSSNVSYWIDQNLALTVGQSYTMSVWVKSNTGLNQQFRIAACNSVLASASLTATNEWQRFTFSFVAVAGNFQSIISTAFTSTVDLLIWGAQINIGTTAQPYQVTTSPARSGDGFVTKWYTQDGNGENLLLQSQTFENASWSVLGGFGTLASITANSITAPDSTLTADTIAYTSGAVSRIGQSYTNVTGVFYTLSIYVKKISSPSVSFYLDFNGSLSAMNTRWGSSVGYPFVSYNFDTDVVSSSCSFFGRQILPNGWVRIYLGTTCISGGTASAAGLQLAPSESLYIWGAQLSQSNWLQPYNPTTTTAILRRDASQTTAVNQPRIVNGGVIERENGRATMFFDGVNDNLQSASVTLPTYSSVFLTSKTINSSSPIFVEHGPNSSTTDGFFVSTNSIGSFALYQTRRVANQFFMGVTGWFPASFSLADFIYNGLLSVDRNGVDVPNGAITGTSVSNTNITNILNIGSRNAASAFSNSDLSELIVYPSDQTANRSLIQRNIGAYYQTQWTGASSGLLDQFGGAAAAYSLRNLSSSYRGPLIRVRRSSDNAETDIGGTYNGQLDIASLLSFTGGQNLVFNSEDFSLWTPTRASVTTNSTIAPNGTLTADSVICNTTSTNGVVLFSNATTSPSIRTDVTGSVYIKAGNKNFAAIVIFDGTNGVRQYFNLLTSSEAYTQIFGSGVVYKVGGSIQNVGNGWYRCSLTVNFPASSSLSLVINPVAPSDRNISAEVGDFAYVWGAQLNTGILQPYIPTTTTAVNGANAFVTTWYDQSGITENLLLQSQTFENAIWSKFNSSLVTNDIIAPDGTLTAEKLNETAVNGQHGLVQVYTIPSASVYTFSFYVKAAERSVVNIVVYFNGGATDNFSARFNLSTGVVISTSTGGAGVLISSSIQPAGSGWYRCSITGNTTMTGSHSIQLGLIDASSNTNYLGVAGSGVYVWGAQLNTGTLVSYTPTTTTASQLRNAIQTTAANQPRIVNGGGVESEGNRPAMFFDGVNSTMGTAGAVITSNNFSTFAAFSSNQTVNGALICQHTGQVDANRTLFIGCSQPSAGSAYIFYNDGTNSYQATTASSQVFDGTGSIVYSDTNGSGLSTIGFNGVQDGSVNGSVWVPLNSSLRIGALGPSIISTYLRMMLSETILYNSRQSSPSAISSNINSNYQIYWQGNGTALLDNYSGASAAYSLRNLSSAYTGPLIRVRRSSDNVERDIYGTFGGNLDIASLVAFVGANSAFITTWYDQSGNARHATQSTAANQPRIVNAGVVDTQNGKPAAYNLAFNGMTFSALSLTNFTVFWVSIRDSTVASQSIILSNTTNPNIYFGDDVDNIGNPTAYSSSPVVSLSRSNTSASNLETSHHLSYVNRRNNTEAVGQFNNSSNSYNNSVPSLVFNINSIGIYSIAPTYNYVGKIQEILIYSSDISNNRNPISSNINSYYGLY